MNRLKEAFLNPPNIYRPFQILESADGWDLMRKGSEGLSREEQLEAAIATFQRVGIGGVVISVSYEGRLESEEEWAWLKRKFEAYQEAGLGVWIYDERGYPSGKAGGVTLKDNPEYRALGLGVQHASLADGGEISLTAPVGADRVLAAFAYPRKEGAPELTAARRLDLLHGARGVVWQVPDGDWDVYLLYTTYLYPVQDEEASRRFDSGYINVMDERAVAKFLRVTHERYAEHLGAEVSRFVATFTDEPSLHVNKAHGGVKLDERLIPWAHGFDDVFRSKKGYDLLPYIPALFRDVPAAEKYRYDFREAVAHRIEETYFEPISEWCAAHDIMSSGHLFDEERLTLHTMAESSLFTAMRQMQLPGCDVLSSSAKHILHNEHYPEFLAPVYAASVSNTYGRAGVMCEISALREMLEGTDWQTRGWVAVYMEKLRTLPPDFFDKNEIFGSAALLYALGVTHMNSFQSHFSEESYRTYNDLNGRLAVLMRDAKPGAKVAILYPISSIWTDYVPGPHGEDFRAQRESLLNTELALEQLARKLVAAQVNFDFVDEDRLLSATPDAGQLPIGLGTYTTIVVPPMRTMTRAAYNKLLALSGAGISVYWIADAPELVLDEQGPMPAPDPPSSQVLLADVPATVARLQNEGLAAVELDPADPSIVAGHRLRPEAEVFLLVNTENRSKVFEVRLKRGGVTMLWDPMTGETGTITPPTARTAAFSLSLGPHGAKAILVSASGDAG